MRHIYLLNCYGCPFFWLEKLKLFWTKSHIFIWMDFGVAKSVLSRIKFKSRIRAEFWELQARKFFILGDRWVSGLKCAAEWKTLSVGKRQPCVLYAINLAITYTELQYRSFYVKTSFVLSDIPSRNDSCIRKNWNVIVFGPSREISSFFTTGNTMVWYGNFIYTRYFHQVHLHSSIEN